MVADVGNSSIHLGEFRIDQKSNELPTPLRKIDVPGREPDFRGLEKWIGGSRSINWQIGSVNRQSLDPFVEWIQTRDEHLHVVTHRDFRIPIVCKSPERVGIDRLAAAVAANQLRQENHAAIVVDTGTAITIDCVTAAGQFLGGMIAPGLQSGFTLLKQNTDQLPSTSIDPSPGLIADNTKQAIQSGVYWMAVGGIENIISKMKNELAGPCSVFVTGGSMNDIYPNLQTKANHVPHLVLSGLALTTS